jgi:DNA modification methylase
MTHKRSKRQATETTAFGTSGKYSHDSSRFYASRLYEGQPQEQLLPYSESDVPSSVLDKIVPTSSESMVELPENSIHLMITSPPYNAKKEYDLDLSLDEYLALLNKVWIETYRVLVPGGRACINVASLGRKPYIPLHALIIQQMLEIGFLMRGEIIWNKAASAAGSTAWGSWLSPANPTLRDVHEYILVFCKNSYQRANPHNRTATISKDEFLEFNKSVWNFATESARKIGHPAPFPIELPYRLIQLYTFQEDVVLDPFMGSGQTALAAQQTTRHFVGYENVPNYVQLANNRLAEFADQPAR